MPRRELTVRDAMTSPVVTVVPTATLEDVARLMLEKRIGCVVVVEADGADVPVGIVTETDFDVSDEPVPFSLFEWPRLFGEFVWSGSSLEDVYERARSRAVETVMTSPVETVDADAPLWDAVDVMVRNDVKRVPALEDGRLAGILTRHDLLKVLVPEALP